MQKLLERSEDFIKKIENVQQFISNFFLIFMMTIITIDVIGRNFLNHPLKGTFEMTELSSALLVFFALAITHRHEDHIGIDFVTEKLPEKVKKVLYGIVELAIMIMLFFMARHIFDNGLRMMERQATTTDLALPIYPVLFIITFTLIIFGLTALLKALNHFRLAVNKE